MKKIIFTSVIILILDILTKQLIISYLLENQSITIIPNFFSLTYAKNTGIAFSFLEGKVPFIIIMTLIIILIIIKYLKENVYSKLEAICYSLVISGALGNLIDRLRYGYVIDFLDFNFFDYHFPIFNLADCAIVIGIISLLLISFKESREEKHENNLRTKK